jgi:tetratricopeptide (TPR) repeat protein
MGETDTISPNISFYYNNRGLMYYHTLCFEDAIKDYEEAIKYDSTSAETFYNRANVYLH